MSLEQPPAPADRPAAHGDGLIDSDWLPELDFELHRHNPRAVEHRSTPGCLIEQRREDAAVAEARVSLVCTRWRERRDDGIPIERIVHSQTGRICLAAHEALLVVRAIIECVALGGSHGHLGGSPYLFPWGSNCRPNLSVVTLPAFRTRPAGRAGPASRRSRRRSRRRGQDSGRATGR